MSTTRWTGLVSGALLAALIAAGCGSSSKASTTTTAGGAGGASTSAAAASASATSAPATTAASSGTLPSDLCHALDPATLGHILHATVGACRAMGADGAFYGQFADPATVQITSFTGAELARRKVTWPVAFKAVPGVGHAAYSNGAFPLPNGKVNAVLYVDYGSFAIEYAVTAPGATIDQAVAIAKTFA